MRVLLEQPAAPVRRGMGRLGQAMRMPRRLTLLLCGAGAVIALTAVAVTLGLGSGSSAARPPTGRQTPTGWQANRAVPPLPLLSEGGTRTSLAAYRGKLVVFAPFLTLCGEVCPITTGAFLLMHKAVQRAGLANKVVFAEISVDPWRDTPRRLLAYRKRAKVTFPLLTGTRTQLGRFWHFFGVGFQKTPQGTPPDTDWLTGKPLSFDVTHTDALFFLGPTGREKRFMIGMGTTNGKLPARLKGLLSSSGLANLEHPVQPWTIPQALAEIGHLLGGKQIRLATS